MKLIFDRGTLVLYEAPDDAGSLPGVLWDPRIRGWRAPACYYTMLSGELSQLYHGFHDEVHPQLADPPSTMCPELDPIKLPLLLHGNLPAKGESLHCPPALEKPAQR